MIVELIILSISLVALVLLYVGRMKSNNGQTFLFSNTFLSKTDENIFEVIKITFKGYAQISHSISVFIAKIPHAIAHTAHNISHRISQYTSKWVETIKNRSQGKSK